jgi:hypothetical protein
MRRPRAKPPNLRAVAGSHIPAPPAIFSWGAQLGRISLAGIAPAGGPPTRAASEESKMLWNRKKNNDLPVVYVPFWQAKDLMAVYVEVEEVNGYKVVYLWFHWLIDWPFPPFNKPELEPLAIAFRGRIPEMVFHRRHNILTSDVPVKDGSKVVVFIGLEGGHSFWAGKLSVGLATLLQTLSLYTLYRRVNMEKIAVYEVPENINIDRWDRWTGESFKEYVRNSLLGERPKRHIFKKVVKHLRNMLRTSLHLIRAVESVRNLDVSMTCDNLIKAYLNLPKLIRRTILGYGLLEQTLEFIYAKRNNIPIPRNVAEKRAAAFTGLLLLTPFSLLLSIAFKKAGDWNTLLERLRKARKQQTT